MPDEEKKKPSEFWVIAKGLNLETEVHFPEGKATIRGKYFKEKDGKGKLLSITPKAFKTSQKVFAHLITKAAHSWRKATAEEIERAKGKK